MINDVMRWVSVHLLLMLRLHSTMTFATHYYQQILPNFNKSLMTFRLYHHLWEARTRNLPCMSGGPMCLPVPPDSTSSPSVDITRCPSCPGRRFRLDCVNVLAKLQFSMSTSGPGHFGIQLQFGLLSRLLRCPLSAIRRIVYGKQMLRFDSTSNPSKHNYPDRHWPPVAF